MAHEDLGPTLNAVGWTEAAIATILVGIRLFVRTKIVKHLGWDDYLMVLALVGLPPTSKRLCSTTLTLPSYVLWFARP